MRLVVELIRLEENERFGTLGILKIDKRIFCGTLEPADRLNQVSKSSIPAQQYTCRRYSSEKYPETFEVSNVPGRSHILFHPGNFVEDTAGCILLGRHTNKLSMNNKQRMIVNSGNTFKTFIRLLHGINTFHLTIREVF